MAAEWTRSRWIKSARTENNPAVSVDERAWPHEQQPNTKTPWPYHVLQPALHPALDTETMVPARAGLGARPVDAGRVRGQPARGTCSCSSGCCWGIRQIGGIPHVDDRWRTSLRHHLGRHRRCSRVRGDLPLTMDMADLNSNEKHADLPDRYRRTPAGPERSATAISCSTARTRWLSSTRRSLVLLLYPPRTRG